LHQAQVVPALGRFGLALQHRLADAARRKEFAPRQMNARHAQLRLALRRLKRHGLAEAGQRVVQPPLRLLHGAQVRPRLRVVLV